MVWGGSQGEDAGEGAVHPAVTWGQEELFLGPGAGEGGRAGHKARPAAMVPPAPPLQEYLECLPGAGGHLGSEPRVAAQVHHAGHGHHAEAGEAAPLRGLSGASWAGDTGGSERHVGGLGGHQPQDLDLLLICWGPGFQLLGPPVTPHTPPTHPHIHTLAPELGVEAGSGSHGSFSPGPQGGDSGQKPPSQGSDAPGCTAVSGCCPPHTPLKARTWAWYESPGLTPGSLCGVPVGLHLSFMGPTVGSDEYYSGHCSSFFTKQPCEPSLQVAGGDTEAQRG